VETDAVSWLVCPVGIVVGPTIRSDFTVLATTDTTSVPDAVESLALITVVPIAIAVTAPVAETVATPGFDDAHVAVIVTSCVVVADGLSIALSWPVCPTAKVSPPVKEMDGSKAVDGAGVVAGVVVVDVVEAVVGELEQPAVRRTSRRMARRATGITPARA
jgi:hypothetical protein